MTTRETSFREKPFGKVTIRETTVNRINFEIIKLFYDLVSNKCILSYFVIPPNEIRRFGILRNGTEHTRQRLK